MYLGTHLGPVHFSTLAVSQLVCKVSIDLLTLAGLSTNISADRPANPGWCTVSLQTCRPWQVYGQFSDRVDLMSQTCRPWQVYGHFSVYDKTVHTPADPGRFIYSATDLLTLAGLWTQVVLF